MAGEKILWISTCLSITLFIIVIVFSSNVIATANVGNPSNIFNKSDLVSSASNNAKVVGVKKHKNYEIVVYEYDDVSGEKRQIKNQNGRSNDVDENEDGSKVSTEVNDNSIELPAVDHPTPPSPIPRRILTNKPRVLPESPTKKPSTIHFATEKEEEALKESASEEDSVSVEAETTTSKPKPPTPVFSKNNKKSTTERPQLPVPFRPTQKSTKKKITSESESGSDEYDDGESEGDYGSDEDYSSDSESDRTRERGKLSSNSNSKKKAAPKKSLSDSSYDSDYDDDSYEKYSDEINGSKGKATQTKKKQGNGKVTPKPFFPLIYDDSDDSDYEDDEETTTKRSSLKKNSSANSKSSRIEPTKSAKRKKSKNDDDDDEDDEDDVEDEWGIDKSLKCKDPKGKAGICQEYSRCSIFYNELLDDYDDPIDPADYKCRLPTQVGICCPLVSENDISIDEQIEKPRRLGITGRRKQKRRVINPQVRRLIKSNLNNSLDFGDYFLEDLNDIERDLLSRSVQVSRNTPEFGHTRFFPTSKRIRQISNIGLSLLQTSNDISERLQLTNEIGGQGLKNFKSSNIEALNDRCPFQRPCRTSKYRTSDGSCNNLQKPKMGQSLTPLARILEPAYADGRWVPRISVRGFELPSARLLSQNFIRDRDFPDNRYTLMVMQFGQFLDHDLTSVPVFTFANNSGINCCQNGQFLEANLRHPNCFPIEIPASDPFYSRFGQRCMNFVRSRMAPRIDCSLGYADQMNALTHWIDASNIYGSTDEQTRQLRLFQGGLLRFSELGDGKMLLPIRNTGSGNIDYRAGDDRVNEMQGLMIMHLVWFREHNRLAFELARLNPFWEDEELFQEARRILTAEYQHIIYNEWLPIIIGRKYMEKAGIVPLTKGYYKGYDPRIDASIANAFSVAAFRMGHTLVQGMVRLIDEMGRDNEVNVISQNDVNSRRTRQPRQVDKWLRGMAQQPVQSFDPFVTEHLNGRLFQGSTGLFGMDLSSLNIQRSRDHGVPGYNNYRELCQVGRRARSFDDYKDWIPSETVDKMATFYPHHDDVDLWIGGINERPLPGALVGPTFACIIGDQFTRSKKGDRYFHDIGGQAHSFSPEQLREIRKVTFARILCDNGDDLEALQPAAFLQADFDFNSLVDCKRSTRIPRMNLRLWQKEPTPII